MSLPEESTINSGKKRLTVSICLCTYNGETYIAEQLDSIFSQSVLPDEVIAVDDHSTDSTPKILSSYQKQYPSILKIYLNKENLGYARNFPKAYSYCSKDIVFFADQDDIWAKDKIEVFLSCYHEDPSLEMVASNPMMFDGKDHDLGKYISSKNVSSFNKRKDQWKVLLRSPLIPGTAMSVKRDSMAKYLPIPDGFMHDEWFSLCASFSSSVIILDEPYTKYRQHEKQVFGGGNSFASKANEQLDYSKISKKYSLLATNENYEISKDIRNRISGRADFLNFRSKLRNEGFFLSLFDLLIHPVLSHSYHLYCLNPFLSKCKDLLTRKTK